MALFYAIGLKIPDNEVLTAAATLRRLGVDVGRVERSQIGRIDTNDAAIFNPNKHALTLLEADEPRAGEIWIEERDGPADRFVGWRLYRADGEPADRAMLELAAQRLLCNPAIERARFA